MAILWRQAWLSAASWAASRCCQPNKVRGALLSDRQDHVVSEDVVGHGLLDWLLMSLLSLTPHAQQHRQRCNLDVPDALAGALLVLVLVLGCCSCACCMWVAMKPSECWVTHGALLCRAVERWVSTVQLAPASPQSSSASSSTTPDSSSLLQVVTADVVLGAAGLSSGIGLCADVPAAGLMAAPVPATSSVASAMGAAAWSAAFDAVLVLSPSDAQHNVTEGPCNTGQQSASQFVAQQHLQDSGNVRLCMLAFG